MKVKNRVSWPQMTLAGDSQVAARFLAAVRSNPEDAWAFVSKLYAPGLDLNALSEVLADGAQFVVSKALYTHAPKKYLTRSVYVESPERVRRLLHLRMVREPDHNGPWKIFGVEEECVQR